MLMGNDYAQAIQPHGKNDNGENETAKKLARFAGSILLTNFQAEEPIPAGVPTAPNSYLPIIRQPLPREQSAPIRTD